METLLDTENFFYLGDYFHASLFENCSYPWEALEHLQDYLKSIPLGKIEIPLPPNIYLVNPETISIGEGTVIEPGAYIQGPCVIGKNCAIRHGAYLRGNVLVGDSCVVGHATEIKHSILFDRVSAAHFNYVGDSVLGNGCNLGAGVVCANFRLDQQPVSVCIQKQKIPTRLKKLGAIVGDGVQVGCHCVINPGTVLGKNCRCFPCLSLYGFVPENSIVRPATKNSVE
jgi:UDP-N-acetylglucosamine diphosphorylase / glucose-1-phosphate thymidylyltransferase / UDP-N-acetylgalactosamine diphosphorylase / glucosamine-1-phosphate N-acetyltransferase / galactosamine-1-phosphate N-acetyltransferase